MSLVIFLAATSSLSSGLSSTTTLLSVTTAGTPVTSVTAGTIITLTATVKAGTTAVMPGLVKFCDANATYCSDIHIIGTAQLTSAGTAVMKFVPGVGSHNYKAVFVGTKTYATSASTASSLTVASSHTGTYPTHTTLVQSGVPGNYTLSASVAAVTNGSAPIPSGIVSFLDTSTENSPLGTASLTSNPKSLAFYNASTVTLAGGADSEGTSVAIADLNGDGIPDLVLLSNQFDLSGNETGGAAVVYLGNGDGTFTQFSSTTVGLDPVSVAIADFNNDGIPDLVIANKSEDSANLGGVTILLGNGDGTFAIKSNIRTGYSSFPYPVFVTVGDFNGDGNADVAVANLLDQDLTILLGDGSGNFTSSRVSLTFTPSSLAVADVNGDGIEDLIAGVANVAILLGNGDGTFTEGSTPSIGSSVNAFGIADFNNDGKADLVIAANNETLILLGNGDGTFSAPAVTSNIDSAIATVGDFNGDGIADAAYFDMNGSDAERIDVQIGKGDGTFSLTANTPFPYTGPPTAVATGDVNGDGRSDLVFALNKFPIWLAEPAAAVAVATGISPFGSGTDSVEASYPGDSNFGSSVSGTVSLVDANVQATLSSPSLSFGDEPDGYSTGSQNVTLTNGGTVALSISSIRLNGANPTQFASSNTCGTSLAAGGSCRIGSRFAPSLLGPLSATVTLTDNGPGSPQTISLTGTGITAPGASLSLSSTNFAFGGVGANTSSKAINSTVTNTSNATIYFTTIVLGGANPAEFVTSNTCGTSLASGSTCNIGARFAPNAAGSFSAMITLTDNASGSPQTIALSGTGIGALASLSNSTLSFGSWPVGYSTAIQTFSFSNDGYSNLTLSEIKTTGAASSFSSSGNCTATIFAPDSGCTTNARFIPNVTGPLSATISFTDNAPGSPQQITLTGTGITPPLASMSLSATSVNFPNQKVGTSSTTSQNIIVTNTGSATLYFKSITLEDGNPTSFVTSNTCGVSISAGKTCKIGVRFVPQVAGPLSSNIAINDNATGSPQIIMVSGNGE